MLTLEQAREELETMTDPEGDPTLPDGFLDRALAKTQRAGIHATATEYTVGQRVVPAGAAYNGRVYLCVEGGTSGEAAPDWPKMRHAYMGQAVEDGDVVWEDVGALIGGEVYDLQAAACECWTYKAGLLAKEHNFSGSGQKFDREPLQNHCLAMAAYYSPAWVE